MPIQTGDVKLLKSAVMADVAEGGGAPTGNVIADGVSNAIFPDISELDRAGGRVNMRKVSVGVHTDDTATYFGGNVIVAQAPEDPRVSVTLFSTGATFDTRSQAASRIESYLNKGPEWAGYLYENHIQGQRVIQLFQRLTDVLPTSGQTLVLVQDEGLPTERQQYVRCTSVTSQERTFTYGVGDDFSDYKAAVVTCELSDALRFDFTGSPASRTFARATAGTKIRDTVVADAGTYVGVVPLTEPATLGDFTVQASGIYTQLVPSAQTETPISDVRANGLSAALIAGGGPVTVSLTLAFTTTQNLFVGGPIYPGSLSIERGGVTLTDKGGQLMNAGAEVGSVDYDAGIVSLSSNVYGTGGGTHSVTFTPAAAPDLISDQRALRVTAETRSLSYAFTLDDVPARRTLSIAYMAQGRWYVLRDDGAGTLKGNESAYGVGTVNYTTGAVVVTLGALPDVGSAIVIQSFSPSTSTASSNTHLANAGKVFVPLNTSGQVSEEPGAKPLKIGGVAVRWNDGTADRVASDDGAGNLTGDGTGTVDYSAGVVRLSPNLLPAAGTVFLLDAEASTVKSTAAVDVAGGYLGSSNITPGSVSFSLSVAFSYAKSGDQGGQFHFQNKTLGVAVKDDGAGVLYFKDPGNNLRVNCGSVNYAAGTISVDGEMVVSVDDIAGPNYVGGTQIGLAFLTAWRNLSNRIRTCARVSTAVLAYFSDTVASPNATSVAVNNFFARVLTVPNYTLKGAQFTLGGLRYVQLPDNTLVHTPSPTTGGGTPAGLVLSAAGSVQLNYWTAGQAPTIGNWRGVISPPSVGVEAPFTSSASIFRTAASPLRPGSLSLLGTMMDGTTFNVTAGVDGKINGTRIKGSVDYEYGLIELYFVDPNGPAERAVDLSHLGIAGLTTIPADLVMLNSVRYNAVSYSYLPLDAALLGIDPVRLPSDGRVPIFRAGGFAVVGHTGEISATVANGQTVDCARVRLSRVRVVGNDGVVINTGYSADLEAGTVTFTDVAGYSQPVTIEHRIEDMAVVREATISGEIAFTRALTHNYPAGSYVSSALITGDLFARHSLTFDQLSWDGSWQDSVKGAVATGTYNAAQFPIAVTNRGAITERWALRFTSTSAFEVIGENVGVIATGNVAAECAPLNPATGVPYFRIDPLGWGAGWGIGNVVRFNTIGAQFPVWVVRTVQQGPETVPDDQFTLLIRGDVDTL